MKGNVEQGGRVQFLTPEGNGAFADVIVHDPPQFTVFRHIGEVHNYEEQPLSGEVEKWSGAIEAYYSKEHDGITTLTCELDTDPQYESFYNETFPRAFKTVKEIAEAL